MNSKIREIRGNVAKYFSMRPEIKFAYLFGSQAKNKVGKLSDVDIAVYLKKILIRYF